MSALGDRTWTDLETDLGTDTGSVASAGTLLVPVGATEQHGPHLPLSTDTDIAVAVARRAAARRPGVVVAPPLPYGASGEHQAFPGTMSIGGAAVELVVTELTRSAALTFGTVVYVSAHGGNAEPMTRSVARLRAEGHAVHIWSPRWRGDAHAGRTETSVMLAIDGTRVRRECAAVGNTTPLAVLLPQLRARGVRAASANGVLGDPAGASAQEGWLLLDAAAGELATMLDTWTRPGPERSGATAATPGRHDGADR